MKKRLFAALFSMLFVAVTILSGTSPAQAANKNTDKTLNLAGVTYTTVTEGFDWGPAITKVILYMGTQIDSATLTKNTFSVSSRRIFSALDYATGKTTQQDVTKARTVTKAYVSTKTGKKSTGGKYITLEMQVGPTLSEGSPFAAGASGSSVYADTSYIIKLNDKTVLKTKAGKTITLQATDAAGYKGNSNVIADQFDRTGTYTDGKITLSYASYEPTGASKKNGSNPLIIWLHGAGEGGTDPTIALFGNKVVNLATDKIQSCFGETGAYVLVPQSPTMWMDYDGKGTYNNTVADSKGQSYYTKTLMGLIDEFVKNHPEIDTNRIYIGGCSNGGYMTINMITTYPDYFAAAYPICEAYDNANMTDAMVNSIKNLPIWIVAAKNDPVVQIFEGTLDYSTFTYTLKLDQAGKPIPLNNFSNAVYNRLVAAGAKNVHYSLFDNVVDTTGNYFKPGTKEAYEYIGHFSWIYALNNECTDKINGETVNLFDWLAAQSK